MLWWLTELIHIMIFPYVPGQLSSEFWTERYSEGDHTVSLILTRQDGASKRFDQTFSVQPLVSSSSHAGESLTALSHHTQLFCLLVTPLIIAIMLLSHFSN